MLITHVCHIAVVFLFCCHKKSRCPFQCQFVREVAQMKSALKLCFRVGCGHEMRVRDQWHLAHYVSLVNFPPLSFHKPYFVLVIELYPVVNL